MSEPAPDPPSKHSAAPDSKGQASLMQVAGAVFWSFFGVRKGRDMLQDATTIKPLHVIIVGVVACLAFILALLLIVRVILRNAAG